MNKSQIKICQNCKIEFVIEPEDFVFYEKINVPPPTFCPECRLQRRLAFRNEGNLYKRKCDLCGKDNVSIYHQDSPYTIYCQKCWWSDRWNPMNYGKDYDFSKSFFQQFKELMLIVPRTSLLNSNSQNSEYTHLAADNKDCYMLFESSNNERCDYSYWMQLSSDCMDCSFVNNSQLCYEVLVAWNCYKLFYSKECRDCLNSWFLKDCVGCSDCYGCIGLRNKKYHIFNKPHTVVKYRDFIKEKIKAILNGKIEIFKNEFYDFALKVINKYNYSQKSINSTGNYLVNVKNCRHCFHANDNAENCKYGFFVWRDSKDNMDVSTVGRGAQLIYESINTGIGAYNIKFGMMNWDNVNNLIYSESCQSSSDLFGCTNIRHGQYCILNKQYEKGDYENMVKKIIEHMHRMPYVDKMGVIYGYGDFFPIELSPFGYNETHASEIFPLSEKESKNLGYGYANIKKYKGTYTSTIKGDNAPNNISDDIINEVIECAAFRGGSCKGTGVFRIIRRELEFYRKQNLPIPRLCPNCRHYQRIKQRNPLKLWHRQCQCAGIQSDNKVYENTAIHTHHGTERCPNEFETTYDSNRPEIVYCEQCYQQEVV